MRIIIICLLGLSAFFIGCSNIKMLTPEEIYSEAFLKKIEGIQAIFRDGDKKTALMKLEAMDGAQLSEAEKGKKQNFIGIIHFSNADFPKAAEHFVKAKNLVKVDKPLREQVRLNLASSYYKMEKMELAFNVLETVNPEYYNAKEKEKYYQLKLILAQTQEAHKAIVSSLIYLLKDKKLFSEVNQSEYKSLLMDSFRKLSSSERVFLLEKNDENKGVVIPFLAAEEAMQRYYFGDRAGAEDVLKWLDRNFDRFEDVKAFVAEFEYRIANFSKVDVGAVGVVLPLSGYKERFVKKALLGIDTALNLN
ncbi:MAG: hypothetical protein WEB87_06950, partial [Bacteriovoracaceae bacterium]